MKCCRQECDKEATVHLTEIVDGQMKKIDLCEDCAQEKGVTNPQGFALADLLLGLGASQELEEAAGPDLVCSTCGFTQADFKKSGRLGCPDCYTTFAEALDGMLKQMHKGVQHVGKAPKALKQVMDKSKKLETLRGQLEDAVAQENYELAAQVRDQIKELETEEAGTE